VRPSTIPPREFARRRRRLLSMLPRDGVAVVVAAAVHTRNGDTEYAYRQDSNFWYLTGFDEPEAVLILAPGRAQGESVLFCRERDAAAEQWSGRRLGPERAVSALGVDDAFPIDDLDDIAPGLLEGRASVYYALGAQPHFDRQVMGWISGLRRRRGAGAVPPGELAELGLLLHELRLHKSPAELRVMRRAAAITAQAHVAAMRACRAAASERDLETVLLHTFMAGGARHAAYPCIVGAGANACIMHHVQNDGPLEAGALVLVDAGCELENYASDVTRTWPVSGHFSDTQRALYEVVLAAQQAAIACVRPGRHFDDPHLAATGVLVDGLRELGLLAGSRAEIMERESYKAFTVHRTSHFLGLDVHDVGDHRVGDAWRELAPGMVLTVEPGCYVPAHGRIPRRFRNLGIRIEDDVLVTARGPEVLTHAAPKSVADIEAVMRA
jgi:Xaa-Pro aminopeptidase